MCKHNDNNDNIFVSLSSSCSTNWPAISKRANNINHNDTNNNDNK